MSDKLSPALIAGDPHAESTTSQAGSSSSYVTDWYTRRAVRIWALASIVCGGIWLTAAWQTASTKVLLSWAIFFGLNLALQISLTQGVPRGLANVDGDRSSIHTGLAATFAGIWGATIFILSNNASATVLILTIGASAMMLFAAIPVFTMHRGAYPLYAITLTILTGTGLARFDLIPYPAIFAVALLSVALLISIEYSHILRTMTTGLARFIDVIPGGRRSADDCAGVLKNCARRIRRIMRDEARSTATLDAISEAIITTTEKGLIDYMNPVAEVLTGVEFSHANGRPVADIANLIGPDRRNVTARLIQLCCATGRVQHNDEQTTLRREDGVEYEVEFQISPILDFGGDIAGTSFLIRDVTTKNNLIKNAEWRATHDPLTQLINRTEFENRIRKLLESDTQASDRRHAICFIDFDQFRFLNETHGIEGGNHLLKSIAAELKQKIRGADTLARIGEDKFGVLLYSCPIDKARLIAEGLRRLVEEFQADWRGVDLAFSVSIGVNEIDPSNDDLTDVLSGAEAACEYAKRESGNRIHVFYTSDETQHHRSNSIKRLRDIQSAIHLNRFELYFQHIHGIRGGDHQPKTCELLLRMQDTNGDVVAPRDFLLTAERFQLMPEIDRWVVKATIDALRVEHPALSDMETICVNISGQSVNDDRFLEFVVELLEEDIDNERICFAISEASLISSVERARFFIATLKEMGCRIALDDFGLGNNSFELLKQLQVDYIKISGDFIRNMAYSSVDYEIVLALSRIAKTLKVKTIAEGVTTLATKDSLLSMGVDFVQGFLIDQPRPVAPGSALSH